MKKKGRRPSEAEPLRIGDPHEVPRLDAHYEMAKFAGRVMLRPPDPEHARALVAGLSEQQVRDWLTKWGSTTAAARADEENRAFLIELLAQMPAESYPLPEEC